MQVESQGGKLNYLYNFLGELDKFSRLVLKANEIETAIKLLLNWIRSESDQICIQSNWPKEEVKRTEIEIAEIKITNRK